jgi:hypothetical protein
MFLICIIFNNHSHSYNYTFIYPSPFAEACLLVSSSLLSSAREEPTSGAEPRIEVGPDLQQADALPNDLCRTLQMSYAAPLGCAIKMCYNNICQMPLREKYIRDSIHKHCNTFLALSRKILRNIQASLSAVFTFVSFLLCSRNLDLLAPAPSCFHYLRSANMNILNTWRRAK